ncbi:hypothetical protein [Dendrosporobacter sp. 1207_IL3150]|uniref:hypothetical protein n=1 Tax=Dendrosporobacter sp. 1207_IL3150 TaxID=3084054 RepID=UPI002FD989ED
MERTLGERNLLQRYKAAQFIEEMTKPKPLTEVDVDLFFALVEKITVYDEGRLIVSLLDGTRLNVTLNREEDLIRLGWFESP